MKKNPFLDNYFKTIVCDIDDTISIATTHDWQNAKPIWQTINKLNKLYDQGWTIILSTARGQVSCKGDFKKAQQKYRDIIQKWLERHGVKYHMLSFEKYLAAYYVDDKALTPQEFVDTDFRVIKTGWSGAIVEKRGDRIFKTHHDSLNAAKWYQMASPLVNVPIVYNVIGNTLSLQFLVDNKQKFKINEVLQIIDTFSCYETYVPFSKYIQRMQSHCKTNDMFYDIIPILQKYQNQFNRYNSFCHGDLSIQNMIQTDKGLFLIDPIWNEDSWSSYLLDMTKLLHSYRKYNRMFQYNVFLNKCVKHGVPQHLLRILEVTQFIRVVKYVPVEIQKENIIKITNEILQDVIKRYV